MLGQQWKTSVSSRSGVEDGPIVQPPVPRVDVQCPLPCHADPFRWDNNERENKPLHAASHVDAGEYTADLVR